MSSPNRVRSYFDREARRFDAIYEKRKPLFQRVMDRLFRGVILRRFELVCNLAPVPGTWTVLDIGCGSGRYPLALCRSGASRVVGLDVAPAMVELARREAERAGFAARSEFLLGDFHDYRSEEKFDVVLAMGYFDYLENPLPHLQRMVVRCRGRVFASFPKRWEWRAPTRKLRFLARRGFVRFYSRRQIESLLAGAGLAPDRATLIDLGRDWILVARTR
jgi:SAM-dependent methyltransferase